MYILLWTILVGEIPEFDYVVKFCNVAEFSINNIAELSNINIAEFSNTKSIHGKSNCYNFLCKYNI